MKKLIFALILILPGTFPSRAQAPHNAKSTDCKIGRLEGEIGVGAAFGGDKLNFDKNRIGATFYAEGRYNTPRLPLDVGLQVAGSIFYRDSDNAGDLGFRTWNIMAVSDYNFRRCKKSRSS